MHSCMCFHGWRFFQAVWISCLTLASAALLELVGEADSTTICLHSSLSQLDLSVGFLCFTRCVVQHLGYFISLNSQTCPIWTPWGSALFCAIAVLWVTSLLLRGIIRLFYVSNVFRGVPKWSEELEGIASARPGFEYPYQFYRRPASCPRVDLYIGTLLAGGVPVRSSWSRISLLIKGAPKFWEGLIHDCERCPWELLPYLLFLSSLDEEGLVGLSSHISNGIYFVFPCFLLFCRGGYFKIEVKWKNWS